MQCDFQTFELIDQGRTTRKRRFALADLPDNIEKFGFILGVQKRTFKDQDPVNIQASERVGLLHDALAASGYAGHDLEQFLVRIVFCFFADDTGIFEPRDIFLDLLENSTNEDGSDLGGWLAQLFQVLEDTPRRRPTASASTETLPRRRFLRQRLPHLRLRPRLAIPPFQGRDRARTMNSIPIEPRRSIPSA